MDCPITCPKVELNKDILPKLRSFVGWVHLGLFQEASSCFEEFLRGHEHHFCVFMEYAEMLLMQGSYSTFATTVDKFQRESLPHCQDTDRVDLEHLLGLMKALAGTRLHGITQEKLNEALKFWDYMESTYSVNSRRGVNIIQVHAIEMEALMFQSIVLSTLSAEAAMEGFMRNDLFATMVDQNEAEKMAQRRVVLDLATSNKICEYLLDTHPRLLPLAEAYLDVSKFFKEMLSRKSKLVAIDRGRPLLRVNELEELVNQRRSNHRSNSQ
ncbi:hypothetical protein MGU_07665 [Metarhizium guizhouense ARSEF 977]|uniref:Uncharacterized protein n=1 Tax=Metarhizium guizhouense (strain ARSEF 977) TaxID=1276136 RepID=A0A0B4GDQ8_METGA|nr:hypothetical protein MGU_07665 [Metarhizium guizhouense ARSEF 977]